MRDPKRINVICDLLKKVWRQVPDWRLGQLVCNVARMEGHYDSFFMEDEKMQQALEKIISENKKQSEQESQEG